jgi:hypothetical protein
MNKRKRDEHGDLFAFLTFSNIVKGLVIATLCLIFFDALQDALLDANITEEANITIVVEEAPRPDNAPYHCTEAMLDVALNTGRVRLNCSNPITLTTTKTITEDTHIGNMSNNLLIFDGNDSLYEMFSIENGAQVVMENVQVRDSARIGVSIAPDSALTAENCIFSEHGSAHDDGAAIWNVDGSVDLLNCVIENNHSYDDAAGILNWYNGLLNVEKTTFRNNSAGMTANGMGAAIRNYGTANIINSDFMGNRAHNSSGATILSMAGDITIIETRIHDNYAHMSGAGVYNAPESTMTIIDSAITANFAEVGGGVYNLGTMTLENTHIDNNTDFNCWNTGTLIDEDGACNEWSRE